MARPPRPEVFDCRDCGASVKSEESPTNHGRRCVACHRRSRADATKKWFKRNPESRRTARNEWKRSDAGKRSAIARVHRRRLKISGAGTLTASDWKLIQERADGRCFYCKRRRRLTIDHVTPISKGGAHAAWNVVAACQPCNSSKGAKRVLLL